MKRFSVFGLLLVVGVITAFGIALAREWTDGSQLRAELQAARAETVSIERLQAENLSLRAKQPSESELERLRADHQALPQLQRDLEAIGR